MKTKNIIYAVVLLLGGTVADCRQVEAEATHETNTYYALAPFIGALLSILLLGEPVTLIFIVASIMMAIGCWIAAK